MSKVFPKSANALPLQIVIFLLVFGSLTGAGITYYWTPEYSRVGYQPQQPIPFDHSLHAGQLGLDCRYCHTNVEQSEHSNVPSTQVCMACHSTIKNQSELLAPLRASFESGDPVPWVRIHKAPDYVYFNHSVHVNRGISCFECHGQVNEMEVVSHAKSHTMSFCLECHRAPEGRIRPLEEVFNLDWRPESQAAQLQMGEELVSQMKINPPESCSGCHR